jgi:hypothetical protein
MLILRTLRYGPAHDHRMEKHIQRTINESCNCSTVHFIPPSIVSRNVDGSVRNGRQLLTEIGNSNLTD